LIGRAVTSAAFSSSPTRRRKVQNILPFLHYVLAPKEIFNKYSFTGTG
jgi:hypothetical protein